MGFLARSSGAHCWWNKETLNSNEVGVALFQLTARRLFRQFSLSQLKTGHYSDSFCHPVHNR